MADEGSFDLLAWIDGISEQADTATVVRTVSIVEDWLSAALQSHMPSLFPALQAKLFQNYGPLSTFSAKIDIAFALGLFDKGIHSDLHALRGIRNEFAHTCDPIHFKSGVLSPKFQKLTGWSHGCDCRVLFSERATACIEAIKTPLNRRALVKALREYADRQDAAEVAANTLAGQAGNVD